MGIAISKMMRKIRKMMRTNKTKQGAASIYMVVVCALLFSVIAAGFIVLMTNEMSKSSENNLSQSAYDASLVGIEDMKIAIQKYYECLAGDTSCTNKTNVEMAMDNIMNASGDDKCNKNLINLLKILHGIDDGGYSIDNGVLVQETMDSKEDITQAYTCIDVDLNPTDYLATLTQSSPQRVIPLQAVGGNEKVKSVKISWYSKDNLGNQATKFNNVEGGNPVFPNSDNASIPPVLAVQLYQTTGSFKLSELNSSTENVADYDNRGTLWLTPTTVAEGYDVNYYEERAYSPNNEATTKKISSSTILKSKALTDSNNRDDGTVHSAYPVLCAESSDVNTFGSNYLCSVVINIPDIEAGIDRSDKFGTFLLSLSLPYQTPDTDFKVEMYKSEGAPSSALMQYDQVQMIIDATGRANDIYARTESRVEFYDSTFPFPDYAMTLGNEGETSLQKTFTVTGTSSCWSYNTGSTDKNTVKDCP